MLVIYLQCEVNSAAKPRIIFVGVLAENVFRILIECLKQRGVAL